MFVLISYLFIAKKKKEFKEVNLIHFDHLQIIDLKSWEKIKSRSL